MAEPPRGDCTTEAAVVRAANAVDFLIALYRASHKAGALRLPLPDLYLGNIGCAVVHAKASGITRAEFVRLAEALFDRLGVVPFRPD
jgi:hypothetical protein